MANAANYPTWESIRCEQSWLASEMTTVRSRSRGIHCIPVIANTKLWTLKMLMLFNPSFPLINSSSLWSKFVITKVTLYYLRGGEEGKSSFAPRFGIASLPRSICSIGRRSSTRPPSRQNKRERERNKKKCVCVYNTKSNEIVDRRPPNWAT